MPAIQSFAIFWFVHEKMCSVTVWSKWNLCVFQYMRSLNNFRAEQPHQHAMYYLRLLMTEVAWTKDELRDALDGATLFHCSVKASAVVSCMCVHAVTVFLRCDVTSSEGVHTAAVVTVTHWSSAAWQHHQTGLYEKHFSLMTYRKGRSVSRQVETIPVKINEPYCLLSTVCFGVCLMNLWILFFFCKLVIHWISSHIDKM